MIERRRVGLNQETLARIVGVDRGYISQIENGKDVNLGVKTAMKLADALGVSLLYLIGLTDDPLAGVTDDDHEEDTEALSALDTLTKEFLSIYQQLSEDKKGVLLNLAKMLRAGDEPRIIGGNS